MLRLILKKIFVFFVFFVFFESLGFSAMYPTFPRGVPLQTRSYQYTPTFIQRLQYVAAFISSYYQYQKDFAQNIKIPVAVKYGTYWDLVLFSFSAQQGYTWSGYCYNSGSNIITYYMYSSMSSAKSYIPYSKQGENHAYFWCSQANFPLVASTNLFNLMAVPGSLQMNGVYSSVPVNKTLPVYVYANSGQIRDSFYNQLSPSSYNEGDKILGNFYTDDRKTYILSLSTDVPVWSDDNIASAFPYETPYLSMPYINAFPSDVVAPSTPTVIPSTSVYISSLTLVLNVDLSTTNALLQQIRDKISTAPVSIDMSTTNAFLSQISSYTSVLASYTYVSTGAVLVDTYTTSVIYQATSTIYGIYSDIQSFFSTTFSTSAVWDCVLNFSSITFLNTSFYLGRYDLCSQPPQGLGLQKFFDLIKIILKLLATITAIEIMIKGWIT